MQKMILALSEQVVERLIQIEAGIHYGELPPSERSPFVVVNRESSIILSAPHGAITNRDNDSETWHEEDEYTAGLALLLSEICATSVIATVWRTSGSDPNEHDETRSAYKQELRRMVKSSNSRWLIDLHGAGEDSPHLSDAQKVELGTGSKADYLPSHAHQFLVKKLEEHLGKGVTDRKDKPGFRAEGKNRIAAFAHNILGIHSVQIEMKPSVRVPLRRIDSSMYGKNSSKYGGPYTAPRQNVHGMMQSLVEFIEYLKTYKE